MDPRCCDLTSSICSRPKLARASRARKTACLRSFFAYLTRQSLIPRSPAAGLRSVKQDKRLPKFLRSGEIEALMAAPDQTPLGLRDRALLETLYASGMRAGEMVDPDLADVDFEAGVIRVVGKGEKERVTLLGREAVAALDAYLRKGRPALVAARAKTAAHCSSIATADDLLTGASASFHPLLRQGRHAPQDHAARPPSHVRHASAGGRRGSAAGTGTARPQQHRHDPDLHARHDGALAGRLQERAPARPRRTRPIDIPRPSVNTQGMKIYTRTGDGGETSLYGGQRVLKDALRVKTFGTVDECNAALGVALTQIDDAEIRETILRIQGELFEVGADWRRRRRGVRRCRASGPTDGAAGREIDRIEGDWSPCDTSSFRAGRSVGRRCTSRAPSVAGPSGIW